MPQNITYMKTPAGHQEVVESVRGLDPRTRRVLILIDGGVDAETLQRVMGSDRPLADTLQRLLEAGLIEPAAGRTPGGAAPATRGDGLLGRLFKGAADAPTLSEADRERIGTACRFILEALGPDGSHLCERIEGSRDADDLGVRLANAADVLESVRGVQSAQAFRDQVGLQQRTLPG